MRSFVLVSAFLMAFSAFSTTSAFPMVLNELTAYSMALRQAPSLLELNSKCSNDQSCQSGFCSKQKCSSPVERGSRCTTNAGCLTGLCDIKAGYCVDRSSQELLRMTGTKSSESYAFTQGDQAPFSFAEGAVRTVGKVSLATDPKDKFADRNAIVMQANAANPALVKEDLKDAISTDSVLPSHELMFYYRTQSFKKSTDEQSSCSIIVLLNGASLNLPIPIQATSSEFKIQRLLLAPELYIDQVAFSVTCDQHTEAEILLSNISITSFSLSS